MVSLPFQVFHVDSLLEQGKHPLGWIELRSQASHYMAQIMRATIIAAVNHLSVNTACGERGKVLQRLPDDWQIDADFRRSRSRFERQQARLRQHAPHHSVVDAQTVGYSVDTQLFALGEPEYLAFEFRGLAHGSTSLIAEADDQQDESAWVAWQFLGQLFDCYRRLDRGGRLRAEPTRKLWQFRAMFARGSGQGGQGFIRLKEVFYTEAKYAAGIIPAIYACRDLPKLQLASLPKREIAGSVSLTDG